MLGTDGLAGVGLGEVEGCAVLDRDSEKRSEATRCGEAHDFAEECRPTRPRPRAWTIVWLNATGISPVCRRWRSPHPSRGAATREDSQWSACPQTPALGRWPRRPRARRARQPDPPSRPPRRPPRSNPATGPRGPPCSRRRPDGRRRRPAIPLPRLGQAFERSGGQDAGELAGREIGGECRGLAGPQ